MSAIAAVRNSAGQGPLGAEWGSKGGGAKHGEQRRVPGSAEFWELRMLGPWTGLPIVFVASRLKSYW